jgi:hypothetical protein
MLILGILTCLNGSILEKDVPDEHDDGDVLVETCWGN